MQRNTDRDWNILGEQEPYFGVLTQPRYRSENITPEAIEEFYAEGRRDIDRVVRQLKRVHPEFAPGSAVDFGCGVGRLTLAMATRSATVTGVDVSLGMLAKASERRDALQMANVNFSTTLPTDEVDWVNSMIVFQHIPPERGYHLLARLLYLVRPGGVASIQLTFCRNSGIVGHVASVARLVAFDGRNLDVVTAAPPPTTSDPIIAMYDYDLNRIFAMLFMRGFSNPLIQHTNHDGHHGVWLFARRHAG